MNERIHKADHPTISIWLAGDKNYQMFIRHKDRW